MTGFCKRVQLPILGLVGLIVLSIGDSAGLQCLNYLCLFYPLNSTSSIAELISFREEGFVSALISRFNLVCVLIF